MCDLTAQLHPQKLSTAVLQPCMITSGCFCNMKAQNVSRYQREQLTLNKDKKNFASSRLAWGWRVPVCSWRGAGPSQPEGAPPEPAFTLAHEAWQKMYASCKLGLDSMSGAGERTHSFIYVCYLRRDNRPLSCQLHLDSP